MNEPKPIEPNPTGRTPFELQTRLAIMMFLQYFVQGCYMPIISVYLRDSLGFEMKFVGYVGAALTVGPLFSPFVIGQLVDRRFATQRVLAFCHASGGILMLLLHSQHAYLPVLLLGTLYSVLYVPTMMLTNSLAFHHLRDGKREFPRIRLWGTVGFVAPAWLIEFVFLKGLEGDELKAARGVALIAAGVAGLVMTAYALFALPDTPPATEAREKSRFAPAVAAAQLKRRDVLVLVIASFFAAIVHKFHFVANGPFLTHVLRSGGIEGAWEATISSIGQIAEVGVMALLAWIITKAGFRRTITLGICAYTARCLVFVAADQIRDPFTMSLTLACVGQAFHGLCFSCFMAASFMFFDRTTPSHIRGTVQNLYGTFVLGLGFFVGGIVAGEVMDACTVDKVTNYTNVWNFAGATAAITGLAFYIAFPNKNTESSDADDANSLANQDPQDVS